MNNQANNWVWKYEKNVTIICKNFLRQDSAAAEDVAHDVLLRISQRDGLDQVGDRSKWIRTVAYHECMDYFRKLNRHPDWKGEPLEDPGVGGDEKLSDAKLDKEARGSAEDIENETDRPEPKDEPEKTDPLNWYRALVNHDPEKAVALERSLAFVSSAFGQIRGQRYWDMENRYCRKMLAALRDVTRRSKKKLAFEQNIDHSSIFIIQQKIRELIQSTEEDLDIGDPTPDRTIFFRDFRFENRLNPYSKHRKAYFIEYYIQRVQDFIVLVPDTLYVLYRIWNQILRKGRKGKYGNRKMLKMLLLAYKRMTPAGQIFETLNSLTEETNFETLRTMSKRLNKGYSELADFIFKISIHPPSRAQFKKTRRLARPQFKKNKRFGYQYLNARRRPPLPTEKIPVPPASISLRHEPRRKPTR